MGLIRLEKEGKTMKFLRHKSFRGDPNVHYKMFKVGRTWVFTAMASFVLTSAPQLMAHADTASADTSSSDATSSASSGTDAVASAAASAAALAASTASSTASVSAASTSSTVASSSSSS